MKAFGENINYSSFIRLTDLEIDFIKDQLTKYKASSKIEKTVLGTINKKFDEAKRSFEIK